jgi:hypothetical protein
MQFREVRWPCDYPIGIRGRAGLRQARVVNLSSLGARILIDGLDRGETVRLELPQGWVAASVRWVRAGMAGLRFDQPLGARDMARIRGQKAGPLARPRWNLTLQELR